MAGPTSFIDQAIDNIRSNKTVKIFSNVRRCFLKVEELINVYEMLLKSKNYGTYNLASPMVSYYERIVQICKKKKISYEDEKLQEIFKSLYNSNIKRFVTYLATTKKPEEVTNYAQAIMFSKFIAVKNNFQNCKPNPFEFHYKIKARFGTKFLKENKNWLK